MAKFYMATANYNDTQRWMGGPAMITAIKPPPGIKSVALVWDVDALMPNGLEQPPAYYTRLANHLARDMQLFIEKYRKDRGHG